MEDMLRWLVDAMMKSIKSLISGLAHVDAVRLPGWNPRDPPKRRLETMCNMTQCRIRGVLEFEAFLPRCSFPTDYFAVDLHYSSFLLFQELVLRCS